MSRTLDFIPLPPGTTLTGDVGGRMEIPNAQVSFWLEKNGILLPKLFWPTMRNNCFSDQEKLLKFEAEGRESLEQFIQTVKGQTNFC